jgi:thiol-disulfide isomerase/thioredoxin
MAWSRNLLLALSASLACHHAAAETLLLEFTSPSCGPCRLMRPVMQRMAAEGYPVRDVDISREPGVASQFRVDQVPTFIVLVDGKERARLIGGGREQIELVKMMRTAEAIAASAAPANGVAPKSPPPLEYVDHTSPGAVGPGGAGTFAQPKPGRVVQIDPHPPISRAPATEQPPVPATAEPTSAAHLIAATVRLCIEDPEGRSTGTGTIVDARDGKALVLTCGHLFRSSNGKGAIQISLFTAGPNGAELRMTTAGTLVDFDLDRDLALVCFVADGPVAVAPVGPSGTQTPVGISVTSVGCEHGANPTPWASRITAVDRYQGHPNIEAAGAPVEGRSGGGLFNSAGQLVGVCYAADPQGNEGLYASLPSIHAKLDSLNLAMIHQAPSTGSGRPAPGVAANQVAAAAAPFEVRGQNPTPTATSPFSESIAKAPPVAAVTATSAAPPAPATETTTLTAQDRASLEEINRRGADSEVICIIRPHTPGG